MADITAKQPLERWCTSALRQLSAVAVGCLGAGALMLALPSSSAAAPSVDDAKKQVEKLNEEAEVITEQYNGAKEKQQSLKVSEAAIAKRLTEQEKYVVATRQVLSKLAVETYKEGDLQELDMMLGQSSEDYAVQNLRGLLSDRKTSAMQRYQSAVAQLKADQSDLESQRQQINANVAEQAKLKSDVDKKLSQAKAVLDRLDGTQRAKVTQALNGGGSGIRCGDVSISYPTEQARAAITFACSQLGKPYVYGAEGPGSYDCSGLMQRAWQAAGVSLPRTSQSQASSGSSVSVGSQRPGDLVFFYGDLHHVGIYLGNNLMIHAPRTGDVVKIADMSHRQVVKVRRF